MRLHQLKRILGERLQIVACFVEFEHKGKTVAVFCKSIVEAARWVKWNGYEYHSRMIVDGKLPIRGEAPDVVVTVGYDMTDVSEDDLFTKTIMPMLTNDKRVWYFVH
jgi:hypothetical protein